MFGNYQVKHKPFDRVDSWIITLPKFKIITIHIMRLGALCRCWCSIVASISNIISKTGWFSRCTSGATFSFDHRNMARFYTVFTMYKRSNVLIWSLITWLYYKIGVPNFSWDFLVETTPYQVVFGIYRLQIHNISKWTIGSNPCCWLLCHGSQHSAVKPIPADDISTINHCSTIMK